MGLIGDTYETGEKFMRNFRWKTCSEETKALMAGAIKKNSKENGWGSVE
jgi:hypothetical protein